MSGGKLRRGRLAWLLGLGPAASAYFRARSVPLWRKLLAVFALVYLVWPFDLIPDVIPVLGWLDDLGVVAFVAWFLVRDIQRFERARAAATDPGVAGDRALPR